MIPVLLIGTTLAVLFAVMVAYVRGSLTDRMIMIACTVAMSISFLVYIIVFQWLFGFILGWFPVQGWSESFWKNLGYYAPLPIMLAVFVGLAPSCGCTAPSSSTRSTRITCAPRAPRACRKSR